MMTSPNPAALPAKQQLAVHLRQLCITFETHVLLGTTPEERAAATQALVAVLMQAIAEARAAMKDSPKQVALLVARDGQQIFVPVRLS